MANDLKNYVKEYLLNPAASFNVDNEGNEETNAQVVESLASEDQATTNYQSTSKLRARNVALLSVTDPKYKGKKVSRSDLKKDVEYDPELTKYFSFDVDNDDDDDDGDNENDDLEGDQASDDDRGSRVKVSKVKKKPSKSISKRGGAPAADSEDEEEEEEEELDEDHEFEEEEEVDNESIDDDESDGINEGAEEEEGFRFDDDGDFSKYAEDFEELDDDSDDDVEEEEEEGETEDEEEDMAGTIKPKKVARGAIKKFSSKDEKEDTEKGQSVKNQIALYDSLFEIRIGMQKGVTNANQLPQFDTFKEFIREKDPNYIKNLTSAKSAAKKLLGSLLEVQETLLRENPETRHIVAGKKIFDGTDSDEGIASSENDKVERNGIANNRGTKRKMNFEEYEGILSKRYAALIPFRDETITKWYEKTKLLSNTRGRDKFSGFEVSALQQLKNILNNKPQLIRRTQLMGVTRGTNYHILGCNDDNVTETGKEEYNAEIFDDSDFYSRALEEMLKSKISISDDMNDVSRKWIEIQKLRKKAKRKVDTRASKGRKLRYEVLSKLQQYLAPSNPPQMDDAAINTLFASLFGKGLHVNNDVKV